MKKILLLLLLLTIYPNIVNAQITQSYDRFKEKNIFDSKISMPFNESLVLKYSFNYDQKKNYVRKTTDEQFSLTIKLEPVNTSEKTENIVIERQYFTYSIDNYCNDRKGKLSFSSDSKNVSYGTEKFSVYGDNESGYEILEHYDHFSMGPEFTIIYFSEFAESDKVTASFGNDLLYAIANNATVSIKIPYTSRRGETDPKYFTFWLTKEILAEWAELIQKQQTENKNN